MIRKLLVCAAIAMLFLGVQAGTACANLVLNGSFQTGDFTDWTQSNPGNTYAFFTGATCAPVATEVQLGTNGLGTDTQIYQSIATTAGQSYTVSFWLANDDFSNTSNFKLLWNGAVETTNPALQNSGLAFNYTEFSFTGVATGATSVIAFDFQNDNSDYHLTNVNASPTPIPATMLLFFPPLAGLLGLRSWRSKKA
jgi:hypothetical protein